MTPAALPTEGFTALVVDDDRSIRLLLRTVLELEGWQVIEAADGEMALLLAASRRPHAMVLDVMLPGRDGFGVLAELRHSRYGANIAVVMLTAKCHPADEIRGTRLGADQFLTKPCDPDEVADRLAFHALRRHPRSDTQDLTVPRRKPAVAIGRRTAPAPASRR